jgi:hypothetical protein
MEHRYEFRILIRHEEIATRDHEKRVVKMSAKIIAKCMPLILHRNINYIKILLFRICQI